MKKFVVIHDPTGKFWPGAVIEPSLAQLITTRIEQPVVALPVDPELLRKGGAGAYTIRSWGAGWPIGDNVPSQICTMCLYVPESHQRIEWIAKVVRIKPGDEAPRGYLRILADTAAPFGVGASMTTIEEAKKIEDAPRCGDGWLLSGASRANMCGDGHQGLALYGLAPGLAVAWAAASTIPL